MSFREAWDYLEALGVDAMKSLSPTTHRMEALCDALNHPERQIPAIHIGGTNGKTSTARIVSSILTAAGLSVGTYTSPHLQSVRERIALNGEPISPDVFADVFEHVMPYVRLVEDQLGEKLTYFEILTAMFFLWAAETPVEASVVEVGLGGAWDATNVLPSKVAVITNVQLDHVAMLGGDRETIAREKAGIIKEDGTIVTGERTPTILSILSARAAEVRAPIRAFEQDFSVLDNRPAFGGRYLSVKAGGGEYQGLFLPLHGRHQGTNAATALEAAAAFFAERSLGPEVVAEGFAESRVPGRMETTSPRDDSAVKVLLDVAHNPDGMSALVTALLEEFAFERVKMVIGILSDKDYAGMLAEVARVPATLFATQAKTVRSVPLKDLVVAAEEAGLSCVAVNDVADAIKMAIDSLEPGDLLCVTGSHYVVGEARDFLVGTLDG